MTQQVLPLEDGGRLEVFSLGEGPGIVVVHGAMVTIHQYWGLLHRLHALSGLPVHFYHRRGRGASSDQPANYSMRTETQDAAFVLSSTGSRLLVGHSFGGAVALLTARKLGVAALDAVVTYDAAVNVDGSFPTQFLPQAQAALDAHRPALATAIMGRHVATVPFFSRLPTPVLSRFVETAAKTSAGAQLEELAAATLRELSQIKQTNRPVHEFDLDVPALLIAGTRSPRFFQSASRLISEHTSAAFQAAKYQYHDAGTRGSLAVTKRMRDFLLEKSGGSTRS